MQKMGIYMFKEVVTFLPFFLEVNKCLMLFVSVISEISDCVAVLISVSLQASHTKKAIGRNEETATRS